MTNPTQAPTRYNIRRKPKPVMPNRKFLTVAVALLPLFAQTPPPPPSNAAPLSQPRRGGGRNFLISRDVPDAAAVARGQKIFVAQCGFCHGSNANGGETGPDLIRSPLALNDEGGDKIGPVILNGRTDKGMPAIHLDPEQIKDVAAFLRGRQQAAIDRGAYTIQNIVTGDAAKGQAYFTSHCASCHSPTGDLAGLAGKYDAVALQSRFLYPQSRFGGRRRGGGPRPAGAAPSGPQVTVTTPTGQQLSGSLEYIDDFDIGLRDASGEYHSFARTASLNMEVRDPLAKHEELLKQYTDADMHNILAYLETLK
jgi:cytochrome c oxidase cbb3-type subunit 3